MEVFHGAHLIQSRADIVQRSGHRRKICGEAVIVQTDQKHGEGSDQHIGDEKDIDGPHCLMGDRMAVHLDLFNSPGMGKGEKLLFHRFCHDQEAGYLDAASGAPGAGSCKHQNQQQGFGQLRPEVKICRGISGGGDDGSHLKGRVTQRLAQSGKKAADIPGHDQDGGSDDPKVSFQFLGAESLTEFPAEDQVVDIEINAEQDHKNGYDHLQMRGIAGHAVVFDTESSGAGGAERDAESVKDGHLSDDQQDDLKQSHGGIDSIQDHGGFPDTGHQLFHGRARAFRLHQIHPVSAGHGKNSQDENQDAHAADPVGKAAPEQDAVSERFHICQNAGAGGGETGDSLKKSVFHRRNLPADKKRQCAEYTQQDPAQRHREKSFLHVKYCTGRSAVAEQKAESQT